MTRLRLHFVTALLALLGFLPRCLSQTYSPSQVEIAARADNPYDAKASSIRGNFASLDAPAQAVSLARAYALRDYVTDATPLRKFFAVVAEDDSYDRTVRDEALRYSALMNLHSGNLDAAQKTWDDLGLIRQWRVLGPIAALPNADTVIRPEVDYQDRGATKKWRDAPAIGPRGTLDLSLLFPQVSAGTVLLAASVEAEVARAAVLNIGAASPARVFVNGKQVFEGHDSEFAFAQHSVAIDLTAGKNDLVIVLRRSNEARWLFSARLAASSDELLDQAERTAETHPESADALDTLGQLQELRGATGAHDTFERAARMAPSPERWLRVASACSNSTCTFNALSAGQSSAQNADVLGRLAEYYSSRGQMQKAAALLKQAIAAAPNDFVLRVQMAELFTAQGRNSEAVRELRNVEKDFADVPWLKKQLATRYESIGLLDRALELNTSALARSFDDVQLRSAMARIYAMRQDAAKLRALYQDSLRIDSADTAALAALAQLDAGNGNIQEAVTEFRAALNIAPDNTILRERLADTLSASGQKNEAQVELALALNANLADEHLRRRLAIEDGDAPANPEAAYTVKAADLAAQARRNAPADRASAVELAEIRVESVADNGLSTIRSQQVVYISSEQGARDYATRSVTYSAGAQKFQMLHARVFKSDGRLMEAEDAGDTGPGESVSSMYYDTRTRTIRYPSLEKGDVIELDYRLSPSSAANPYGDYFGELVTFGSSVPRRLQRYVLLTTRPLHVTGERLPKALETNTGNVHVYRWEMRDIAPVPSEARGPATTEVAPYVHVSTFDSWNDLGHWYAQLIAPQFKLDAALREVLAGLIAGKTTDEEKITAIHHFVLRNTHYVALEFGVFSYKPYPVSQVYARRFGDCKDKASLMIALLRAAGIEADLALVRTRRLGDVAADATSISIFNHAVAYIPKYNLWLDGTAEYAGSHELPLDDQGAQALTVSLGGVAQLRRIPVTLPMENYTHRQVRAQLQPDGRMQFTGSAYTRGEDAPGLRREYEVAERQRTSFRNRLAEVLPSVRLDSIEVNGAHDLESDVVVNFSGDLDTNVGRRIVSLTPSWMPRSYVQTLAPQVSRTQDLLLPAPWTTEEELHFVLPEGARIESLPQDTNLETAFGSALVRYQRQGNEIVVKTSVQFRKLRIQAGEYAAFRDFCSQVENAFRTQIKVGL